MTPDDDSSARFTPRPRRPRKANPIHDDENIRAELKRILDRAHSVASGSRDEFADGTSAYDTASMAIIRLASLLERPEFAPWAQLLTQDEITAIKVTGHMTEHGPQGGFNDDLVWDALTRDLPPIVERLLTRPIPRSTPPGSS